MDELQVEYDKERCIGAQKCVDVAPKFFLMEGNKAVLKKSKTVQGKFVLSAAPTPALVALMTKTALLCPVNAIELSYKNDKIVSGELKLGKAQNVKVLGEELVLDPAGYFLIRVRGKKIEVGFCKSPNSVDLKLSGRTPQEIYRSLAGKLKLRDEHWSYLGKELYKAFLAIKYNVTYVQDGDLEL